MNTHQGFTLVELLVTTGIIALLAVVAAPATRRAQHQVALRTAASKVRAYVVEAKELASAPRASSIGVGVYGARLTASSKTVELIEVSGSGTIKIIRSEVLPPEVTAVGINQAGVGAVPEVTISFTVPTLAVSPTTGLTVSLAGTVGTRFIDVNPVSGVAEVR